MAEPLGKDEKWSVNNTTAALVRAGNLLRSIGTSAEILSLPRVWLDTAVMPTLEDKNTYGTQDYLSYPLEDPVEGATEGRMSAATLKKFQAAVTICTEERVRIKRQEQKVIATLLDSLAPDMWDNVANVPDNSLILASNDLHQVWPMLVTASATEGVYKALRSLTDLCSLRMAPGQYAPFAKQFRELLRLFKLNFESASQPGTILVDAVTSALFLQNIDQAAFKYKLDATKAALKGSGLQGLPPTEDLLREYQHFFANSYSVDNTEPALGYVAHVKPLVKVVGEKPLDKRLSTCVLCKKDFQPQRVWHKRCSVCQQLPRSSPPPATPVAHAAQVAPPVPTPAQIRQYLLQLHPSPPQAFQAQASTTPFLHPELQQLLDYHQQGPSQFVASVSLPSVDGSPEDFSEITCYLAQQGASISFGDSAATYRCTNNFSKLAGARKLDKALSCGGINGPAMFTHVGLDLTLPVGLRLIFYGPTCAADLISLGYLNHTGRCAFLQDVDQVLHCYVDGFLLFSSPKQANHLYPVDTLRLQSHPSVDAMSLISDLDFAKANAHLPRLSTGFPAAKLASLIAPSNVINTSSYLHPSSTASTSARALLSSSLRNTASTLITSPPFTSPPPESASSPFFPHLGRRKSVVPPAHPPSLLDKNPPPGFSPRVTLESSPALHAHSDRAQVATPHHLNREESRRVALVEELMRFLHYPRAAAVAKAAQGGSFASASPLGVQDFVNHAKVFGVDSHFKAGHFNNQHMTPSSSTPAPSPGHTMCFDISRLTAKSVLGYTHEIRVVSEKEGYFSVIPAKSGSCKDLFNAMYDYIATTYNAKGHRVEVAHADAEGVLKSMQANFGSIGIVLTLSPPGQHAQRVERYTQTLHQRSRSTLDSLCYVLPPEFLLYLHIAVGAAMNLTPNDVSAPYTPYELLHGRRKTFHKKCPFLPFGTVCSVGMGLAKRARIAKDRNYPVQDVAKSEVGVCMGESSVFPDSYLFYVQSSGLIVPRRVIAVLSPDTIPFGWKAQPSMTRLLKQFPVHLGDMDLPIPSLPNHRIQPVDPSRDTLLAPSPFSGPPDNDTSSDPREQVESLHRMPVPPLLLRHPTPLPVPPVTSPVPLVPSLSSVVPDPVLVVPPASVSPPPPVSPVVVASPPTPPPDPPRRSSRATKGVSSRYAKDFLLSASVVTDVHPCAVLPPVHGLSRAVPSTVAPRASPPRVRSTVFRACAASRPPLPPWPLGLAPASPSRFPLDHVPGHVTSHPCRALLSDLSTHEPLRSPSPLCSPPESSPSLGAEPASSDVPIGLRAPLREQHEVSYASALKNPALFPPALLDASVAKECDKMVPKLAVMDLVTDYKSQVAPDAIYIPCMLLCKPKYHSSGEFDCISSRLALNGAMQKEGTFGDTYAATADEASTLCCMSAFQAHAIQHNYTSQLQYASFDVCGAFLHCPLVSPRMIITKFPPNINHPYAGQLAIVRKSCYGLRQSNKTFADSLHKTILSAGFSVTLDPKIYMRVEDSPTVGEQQRRCYVSTHVDDGEAMFNYRPFYDHLIEVLERRYGELKKAPLTGFTGTTFQVHENGAFSRSQAGYIARFLASINVPGLAVSKVPSNLDLFADTSHTPKCDIKLYRSILGSLIHMLRTRYDIQKEVVHLSSKMSCPTQGDLAKAVLVLRYLSGTPALGPTYHTTKGPVLACYVDCSYGCHVDGRSHGGFTLHIGEDNAPFFVSSRKQKDCVAVGSMEGEYVELSAASRKVLEFRYFLANIGFPQPEPTVIYEDNQSAINLAIAPAVTRKSRHIHIRHHFIRDLVEKKLVTIVHLPTERMLADFLTKPYGPKRFVMFRDRMFNVNSLP